MMKNLTSWIVFYIQISKIAFPCLANKHAALTYFAYNDPVGFTHGLTKIMLRVSKTSDLGRR